jgi:predicted short-subunit dehydrogenase-like oxidoreductase (DUF2520 family)
MKNIILIGSGNVATHLGISLKERGYNIVQVCSNQVNNAKTLGDKLDCNFTDSIDKLLDADLYILAVKDDVTHQLLNKIPDIRIVHTSGSLGMGVFENKFTDYGVLYPLQTFNKNINIDFTNIPLCIEANNTKFENNLIKIGNQLSEKVVVMNSEQRKQLHIAAVFACNFSNHMFSIADTILSKSEIDFKLLLPLINQTVSKLKDKKPTDVQTGPAKRNDKEVIDSHLNNITDQTVKEIYRLISNSIIKDND